MDNSTFLSEVHKLIIQYFNNNELKTICFNLNLDYEIIAGDEKSSWSRELLLTLARSGRLPELLALLQKERTQVVWPAIPQDFEWLSYRSDSDWSRDILVSTHVDAKPSENISQTIKENQGGFNANITGNATFGDIQVNTTIVHQRSPTKEEMRKLPFEPEMILIPAGPFVMGGDGPYEGGQAIIEIPDFYIGRYPITNQEYDTFIQDTGRVVTPELRWLGNRPSDSRLDWPVTGVTWYEALEYCLWLREQTGRTYMLPSEAQWEKAARGTNGQFYPWGNDWQDSRCNTDEQFVSVYAFDPQSPYGVFDLVGNGREWTTTLWGSSYRIPDERYRPPWQPDSRDDVRQPKTVYRVFRGGRQRELTVYRCSARAAYPPDQAGPRENRIGFRVVREA